MAITYKPISNRDIDLLEAFLQHAGDSLQSFRYFHKRPLSVINTHKYTVLGFMDEEPVAYGHLDEEDGFVWLGIALTSKFRGKGLGMQMMQHLLEKAKELKIDKIRLSVDNNNLAAIKLYEKLNFKPVKTTNTITFFDFTNGSN